MVRPGSGKRGVSTQGSSGGLRVAPTPLTGAAPPHQGRGRPAAAARCLSPPGWSPGTPGSTEWGGKGEGDPPPIQGDPTGVWARPRWVFGAYPRGVWGSCTIGMHRGGTRHRETGMGGTGNLEYPRVLGALGGLRELWGSQHLEDDDVVVTEGTELAGPGGVVANHLVNDVLEVQRELLYCQVLPLGRARGSPRLCPPPHGFLGSPCGSGGPPEPHLGLGSVPQRPQAAAAQVGHHEGQRDLVVLQVWRGEGVSRAPQ